MGFLCQKLIVIAAGHIPGTINIEADKQSRALEDATISRATTGATTGRTTTEWKLSPALFHKIVEKLLENLAYISLLLELISNWIDMCLGIRKPEAMAINAFSLTWNNKDFYMFHLSVL